MCRVWSTADSAIGTPQGHGDFIESKASMAKTSYGILAAKMPIYTSGENANIYQPKCRGHAFPEMIQVSQEKQSKVQFDEYAQEKLEVAAGSAPRTRNCHLHKL